MGMGLIWYAVQHKWAGSWHFRGIFWLAAVPGVLAVFVVLAFVREVKPQERAGRRSRGGRAEAGEPNSPG